MTFHPSSLGTEDLEQLLARFALAVEHLSPPGVPNPSHVLAHVLGYQDVPGTTAWEQAQATARSPAPNPLEETRIRKSLWRLLSAQMEMGIAVYDALERIRTQGPQLGFSRDMEDLIARWQQSLLQGQPFWECVAPDVLAVDFEEGSKLYLGSRLASFADALKQAAA